MVAGKTETKRDGGVKLAATYTHLQSQRDCVLQPRVVRHELPWVRIGKNAINPNGVAPLLATH
jgi:hypothetical protein